MNRTTQTSLVFIVLVVLQAAVAASAVWRPVLPAPDAERVRLVPLDPLEGQTYTRSSYVMLPSGGSAWFALADPGRISVRTRPFSAPGEPVESFRIAVCFDDSTCRRFKRLSRPQQEFRIEPVQDSGVAAPAPVTAVLGTENALDVEAPALATRVQVRNRGRHAVYVRLLERVEEASAQPADGEEEDAADDARRGEIVLTVDPFQVGYDSNAYLAPSDSNANRSRLFWPARFAVDVRTPEGRRLDLAARYEFRGRLYGDKLLDEYRNRLRLTQIWRPGRRSGGAAWELTAEEGVYGVNSTYLGRGDDAELETLTDTGELISLADRFDSMTAYLMPTVRRRLGDALSVAASLQWARRDYREDYEAYADIYSLDYDVIEPAVLVSWRPRADLRVGAEFARADKRYDEKFSRDASGGPIREEAARYVKQSALVRVDWGRGAGLRLGGEAKYFSNDDRYEGYWDYSGTALEVSAGWRWEAGHRCELKARRAKTDYDRSHVLNDPLQPLRAKTVWNLRASCEYDLGGDFALTGRLHYKDYDYNSRNFAYTRLLVQMGVRWGY